MRKKANQRLQDRRWTGAGARGTAERSMGESGSAAGPVLHRGTVPQRGGIPVNERDALASGAAHGWAGRSCAGGGEGHRGRGDGGRDEAIAIAMVTKEVGIAPVWRG